MDLYHALNRGVDKRAIFLDTQDYARFVHSLYEFNDTKPANHTLRGSKSMADFVSRPSKRELLVDIHGWCLMGNHYHLLISEQVEGGMLRFLRKLNVGYAKYFNERYKRSGALFEGRTKKILIDSDPHFLHILNYIHLNPLDTLDGASHWRERRITDSETARRHIRDYRWSSYRDYLGVHNFPSIVTTKFFNEVFEGEYARQLDEYMRDIAVQESKYLWLEE